MLSDLHSQELREENKQALLNVISDSITGVMVAAILAGSHEGRATLFRTIGRVFGGLSDTAKAFLIIASTDILLGCLAPASANSSTGAENDQLHQLTICVVVA